MIDNPMDLSRVHEKILMGKYSSLSGFCRDMRLIFNNSRTYNTNKRSRVSSFALLWDMLPCQNLTFLLFLLSFFSFLIRFTYFLFCPSFPFLPE